MKYKTSLQSLLAGIAVLLAAANSVYHAAAAEHILVWPVDPHVKVLKDTQPEKVEQTIRLEAARGEYEPAQIAIRSTSRISRLTIELEPLRNNTGHQIDAGFMKWNFVGYVPINHNTPHSEKIRLHNAPCELPDPLLEQKTISLPPHTTQAVWITVRVPPTAEPGKYGGSIIVRCDEQMVRLPLELTVWPFRLPQERHLFITNWFSPSKIAQAHKVTLWSEAFWPVLAAYARNMAEHRQNVVYTPWKLIKVTRKASGTLEFDYSLFDRYVETFLEAGVGDRIEISHVAHFGPGGWSSREIRLSSLQVLDEKSGQQITLDAEVGLSCLLSDLQRHLEARGWLDRAMIHVSDEPSAHNVLSWRAASQFVHKYAPRIPRIEAIETIPFEGALEIWVPKLSHFHRWQGAYDKYRTGNEFWFYICCHPYGNLYPNRFLDYPTTAVRVLHWINYVEHLAGYLHWGWNFWPEDPFGPPPNRLPPGDTHVVYPGSHGPLNSIRWEIQRESAEDYEYLWLLEEKTRELLRRRNHPLLPLDPRRRCEELARRVVRSPIDWEKNGAKIREVRRLIAGEIIALDQPPVLLWQTEPAEGTPLAEGPIVVEVFGITEPKAKVFVNGKEYPPDSQGCFHYGVRPQINKSGNLGSITLTVEHNGNRKTQTRVFPIVR